MQRGWNRLLAALLLAGIAQAGDLTVAAEPQIWLPDGGAQPPLMPPGRLIKFGVEKPEGAVAAPANAIDPIYAVIRLAGTDVTFVLAKHDTSDPQPGRLFVDKDGDGKMQEVPLKREERQLRSGEKAYFRSVSTLRLRVAGKPFPVSFLYRGVGDRPHDAQFAPLWYLAAAVDVGGEKCPLYVQDADLDGRYGSAADRWYMPKVGTAPQRVPPYLLSRIGTGRYIAGHRVVLTSVEDRKLQLRVTPAKGPDPDDRAAARALAREFWFGRLRESGVRAGDRPRTEEVISWRSLSLAEAKAAAVKEGKPVFVELVSFYNGSTYRMAFTTYPDTEVNQLLRERFIPVRIIREEKPEAFQEYATLLKATNPPAMGVVFPGDKPTRALAGWRSPSSTVYALRTALGEKVARDWTPFFGALPFVVGYEAGMKEAKFTGRPPMIYYVDYEDEAGRRFAKANFTKEIAGKMLEHYTPVLVDAASQPQLKEKYPALHAAPAVLWIDFEGETIFNSGGNLPPALWEQMAAIPVERAPKRTVPAEYAALLQVRDRLRAAMKTGDKAAARAAIAAIEKVGQGVRVQAEAATAKAKLD
ncbi:MAG: DUF255 domain-containing protein [Planctomycetota bacterium]